ncbi:hypothetical protein [Microbacterium sp. ZW T5_56]|uniref:hypothetical protein n=1 Tax=Microbacterium sp. ZW T5_56 TaxID=3378081 RepID=UPI00385313EC
MTGGRQTATVAGLLTVALVGCTPVGHTHPTSTPSSTPESTPAATGELTATNGVLTESEVSEVAPLWQGGRFRGFVTPPEGYDYGGDCHDSAWTALYLTERATAASGTFLATSAERPTPTLVIAVLPLNESELAANLKALEHQLTSCIGVAAHGTTLQEPAPAVDGWSGLHNVSEDEDLYWAAYDEGIVMAQVSPGMATLTSTLASQATAIFDRQLEALASD